MSDEDKRIIDDARDALTAVLMFYRADRWTERERAQWKILTGEEEATTRVLARKVSIALSGMECQFR